VPNRILKESICTSATINKLSGEAECFFYRLLVNCDDFGRMDARKSILIAKCFPLKISSTKESFIEKCLRELSDNSLVCLYEADGIPYLQVVKWASHQTIRNQRGKYPPPPECGKFPIEKEYASEQEIESLVYDYYKTAETAFGLQIVDINRQVRIGESYIDVLIKTEEIDLILELKRNRLSNKSIEQIERYLNVFDGVGVLIGCGLAVNFDVKKCQEKDIAVITYTDDLKFELKLSNSVVKTCDITLHHKPSMLTPNPIQSNPNPNPNTTRQSESNPACAELSDLDRAIKDYCDYRKKIRKPMTDKAVKLMYSELDKLATDDRTKIAILEQSIVNGWTGIFPLKNPLPIAPQQQTVSTVRLVRKEDYTE